MICTSADRYSGQYCKTPCWQFVAGKLQLMEFVKAIERTPAPLKRIFFKYTRWTIRFDPNKKDTPIVERYVGYMTSDFWFKGGWDEDVGDFLTFDKKNIEWLDEGQP